MIAANSLADPTSRVRAKSLSLMDLRRLGLASGSLVLPKLRERFRSQLNALNSLV